ncbi:MAG: AbrB/MazE/SpoVT family DNA-binding domain-containing protein [Lachnospiraceae bacterium]|nr:AbrB/MazE/SpoVT family DNA-binding domain-containing protein [Lachnospiraceae bacterium]
MSQVAIRSWGNSQGIRLSKEIMDIMGLKISDTLDIEVYHDEIILRKAFRHKTFEERMLEYHNKISACDFDWGEPVGRELL